MLSIAPTVVDDGLLAYRVVIPGDQLGGMPLLRAVSPFTVSEKHRWLVGVDQFL